MLPAVEGWSDTTNIVRRSAGLPWERTPESKSDSLERFLGPRASDSGKGQIDSTGRKTALASILLDSLPEGYEG